MSWWEKSWAPTKRKALGKEHLDMVAAGVGVGAEWNETLVGVLSTLPSWVTAEVLGSEQVPILALPVGTVITLW